VPAGVLARTSAVARAISITFKLMRSTSRKSARMPSHMICLVMLTMCAWRICRRVTTSVICMRERSSWACAWAAKMLTWLLSRSSITGRGISASGRGATSSSVQQR
jgi:hypothetical protein